MFQTLFGPLRLVTGSVGSLFRSPPIIGAIAGIGESALCAGAWMISGIANLTTFWVPGSAEVDLTTYSHACEFIIM